MGFRKPDLTPAYTVIRNCGFEALAPQNDGFIQMDCKYELFKLKCYLDDAYASLPKFSGEEEWEQERLIQVLKK